jgi:hypothetical protein
LCERLDRSDELLRRREAIVPPRLVPSMTRARDAMGVMASASDRERLAAALDDLTALLGACIPA